MEDEGKVALWLTQLPARARTRARVGLPQHPPNLWTIGECEGDEPRDPKQEDLHDTEQQQDIHEEHQ